MNQSSNNSKPFNTFSFEFLPEIDGSSLKAIEKFANLNPALTINFCKDLFNEFFKFFSVLAKKLTEKGGDKNKEAQLILFPTAEIQRVWEFFIQNTAKYPLLCENFGHNYIHYSPALYILTKENMNEIENLYKETILLIKQNFPSEINEKIWLPFSQMKESYQNTYNLSLKNFMEFIEINEKPRLNEKINQILKDHEKPFALIPGLKTISNRNDYIKLAEKIDSIIFPANFLNILMQRLLISSEIAVALFVEYKKFLLMNLISEFSIAPSGLVDEVWHLHMLFTREYFDCCKALKGNIILHVPLIENSQSEKENLKGFYDKTLSLYEELFGVTPDLKFWPSEREEENKKRIEEMQLENTFIWINMYVYSFK